MLTAKEIGFNIKQARKLKSLIIGTKYTQKMLADDLKVSRGCIGDIEYGRRYPTLKLLLRIADICQIDSSLLLKNTA